MLGQCVNLSGGLGDILTPSPSRTLPPTPCPLRAGTWSLTGESLGGWGRHRRAWRAVLRLGEKGRRTAKRESVWAPGRLHGTWTGKPVPLPWLWPGQDSRREPCAVSLAGPAVCRSSTGCWGPVHVCIPFNGKGRGQPWNLGKGSLRVQTLLSVWARVAPHPSSLSPRALGFGG